MRSINLPDLLIEVDNDLHFTPYFMSSDEQNIRIIDQVCPIVATIIAHGCNIGPFTMARITDGVEYNEIKRITDWQLTDEAQKQAQRKWFVPSAACR